MQVVSSRRGGRLFVATAYGAALLAAAASILATHGAHPIVVAAVADGVATAVVFAFSVMLDNSSVYDPYWSVAPALIAGYWAGQASPGVLGLRQGLILALLAGWGVRLTANWVRRWAGPRDEDFRYREIRAKTGAAYWPASFFAIHLMPTLWVFLGLLPLFPALTLPGFGLLDLAGALIALAAIAIESIADRQLRIFRRASPAADRLLCTGLWRLCRHPNYLGEMLFWWGLFLFGLAAQPTWAWTAVGPASITLLFVFISTPWMDRHMLARRPAWADHMKRVPALLPRLRRTS